MLRSQKTFAEIAREYGPYGRMLAFQEGANDYREGSWSWKHELKRGVDAIAYDKGVEAAMREAAGERR